jgi:hypothetical protein
MNLVNKTSTITVAVVAALVALAVAAHGSGALKLSPTHATVHGTELGTPARSGREACPGAGLHGSGAGVQRGLVKSRKEGVMRGLSLSYVLAHV